MFQFVSAQQTECYVAMPLAQGICCFTIVSPFYSKDLVYDVYIHFAYIWHSQQLFVHMYLCLQQQFFANMEPILHWYFMSLTMYVVSFFLINQIIRGKYARCLIVVEIQVGAYNLCS